MRLSRLAVLLAFLSAATSARAQVPVAPATEPAPPPVVAPPAASEPAPAPPAPPAAPPTAPPTEAPPPPEPAPTPPSEAAPAPEKAPESAPANATPPPPESLGSAVAVPQPSTAPPQAPWIRAHSPLTLEGSLGFLVRPDSSAGFQDETHVGAQFGFSLYADLRPEFAAGLEVDRASLGRGRSINGLDSVSVDYSVSSAMLGVRAYPKRSDLFDLFIGLQVGVGIQAVSAAGTQSNGALLPASAYTCGATDTPALQIGGGIGARLMLSPRWGVSARINGMGRRLTSEVVDQCAQGIGTATTVSGSLGLGYDFDLDP